MGGVYNHINFNLYHYAGNNPVRYLDPNGREVISLNSKYNASLEKIIQSVCGSDFYFDGNNLKCSNNLSSDEHYSPTARNLLLAAIESDKTAYMYAYSDISELSLSKEEEGELSGDLGFSRRVEGEKDSDIAFFLVDIKEGFPESHSTADHLMKYFSCSIEEANQLGFIHEFLGHVLCDLSIGGYSPNTDIMKYIEQKIREELNWQFTTRSVESENADLSGLYCNLEDFK